MLLEEMAAEAARTIRAVAGQQVVFSGPDVADLTVTAVFVSPEATRDLLDDQVGPETQRTVRIAVLAEDVARPWVYRKVTIAGEVWILGDGPVQSGHGTILFSASRTASMSRHVGSRR